MMTTGGYYFWEARLLNGGCDDFAQYGSASSPIDVPADLLAGVTL
jgi:hypothetical protein